MKAINLLLLYSPFYQTSFVPSFSQTSHAVHFSEQLRNVLSNCQCLVHQMVLQRSWSDRFFTICTNKNVTNAMDHQEREDRTPLGYCQHLTMQAGPASAHWNYSSCSQLLFLSESLGNPLIVCSFWELSWMSEGKHSVKPMVKENTELLWSDLRFAEPCRRGENKFAGTKPGSYRTCHLWNWLNRITTTQLKNWSRKSHIPYAKIKEDGIYYFFLHVHAQIWHIISYDRSFFF